MIDLHCHSSMSDGTDSPEQLIKKASEKGVRVIALTDHDTLDGLDKVEEMAAASSIKFIRGCEISTKSDYGSLHILGLWIPKKCDSLQDYLREMRKRRDNRNLGMLKKLEKLGINIDYDELLNISQGSIGRPHFAQLLIEKGYVESIQEAFSEYLGAEGKAYLPKDTPKPEIAINILSKDGAMVFIAHPLLSKKVPLQWLSEKVQYFKGYGLNGLEAWHSSHNEEETALLTELAGKTGLAVSGGSDYHGKKKPGINLGYVGENREIPYSIYENLLEYRKAKGF